MSLNQSINQIAPHLVSSISVRSERSSSISFSPYLKAYDHKIRSENNQNQGRESSSGIREQQEDAKSKTDDPEIFLLITNPDFKELFLLSAGKQGQELTSIVKKFRAQRGVSAYLPVSDAQRKDLDLVETSVYQKTNTFFEASVSGMFHGAM